MIGFVYCFQVLKKLDGEIKVIVANPNLPPAGPQIPGTTAQLPQQPNEGWFSYFFFIF